MSGNLWAPRAPFRRACVRVGVRARIMRACVPVRAHACPRVPTGACACPCVCEGPSGVMTHTGACSICSCQWLTKATNRSNG